ncbi:MAG: hypothetical protein QN135_10375 [Armatimonadota bacterium]|nr:hypothetical protein [Armatimonadota bacterium]
MLRIQEAVRTAIPRDPILRGRWAAVLGLLVSWGVVSLSTRRRP